MEIRNNVKASTQIVERLTANRPERGDFGKHISDLTACLRRRWIEHHSTNKGASPYALTFLRGSALHQLLSGDDGTEEQSMEADGLIGTIDHTDSKGGIWEWKTTMMWDGKLDNPSDWPESWLSQIAAYCYLANALSINVGVLHLQGDGRQNRLASLRVYTVSFTDDELESNWHNLLGRSRIVTGGDEPPVMYRLGTWECKNCNYLAHCLPELKVLGEYPKTVRPAMSLAEALAGLQEVTSEADGSA